MKQQYATIRFRSATRAMIDLMNAIIADYQAAGFVLTVRQLYYQLVARGHVENTERSYKNIINICNDGRMAGLIDWDAIEDRTRAFVRRSHWDTGRSVLDAAAHSFHMDMWIGQPVRVFLLVEKEALVGVFDRCCRSLDVPLLACRGYPSATVLRDFAQYDLTGSQDSIILHFGDHDPSGIDMTRDLAERLDTFDGRFRLKRIALNMPQIEQYNPPPNPAKITDSRFEKYAEQHGDQSWELDALDPLVLDKLARDHINSYIDRDRWEARHDEIEHIRMRLKVTAEGFDG